MKTPTDNIVVLKLRVARLEKQIQEYEATHSIKWLANTKDKTFNKLCKEWDKSIQALKVYEKYAKLGLTW